MISREQLLEQLLAMPSSLNDACRTMEMAADFISAQETLLRKMEEIHDITQDTTLGVECWQKLQNIAATAASVLTRALGNQS